MPEQFPSLPPAAHLGEGQPPGLRPFGRERQWPTDPATAADFDRAHHYWATITAHFVAFGPWWEKQAQDVVDELDYHNAWHQYEVEQERKVGEPQAEYRAINVYQLQAVSKRQLLALEESGQAGTPVYQVVQHLDALIEQARLEQQTLEQVMAASWPAHRRPHESATDASDEVPF